VLAIGPEYEELAVNEMSDGGRFHATPAVDGSKLLIRSDAFLYCVGRQNSRAGAWPDLRRVTS
jgi:hypothetical protein